MPTRPPIHRPRGWKPAAKRSNPHHDFYASAEWRKLRAIVHRRDRLICANPTRSQACYGAPARIVDHVVPRELGGADHPSNLRSLCPSCHNKAHPEKGYR